MKTAKRTIWLGVVLFSLGMGCGTADSSSAIATDTLAVTGSSVSGEQLALPDADGPCARDKAGPAQRSELSQLESLLGLTAEQVSLIQPILDATRAALESLRAELKAGSVSAADAQAKVMALHEQQKAQILALLTAEQQAKFNQLRDHHCGPFDIARLTAALGLSAEQASQISSLMDAAQAQISALHAQVEAGTLTADAAHAQIGQILAATKSSIRGVLTADQQAQLDKLMAAHRDHDGVPSDPGISRK